MIDDLAPSRSGPPPKGPPPPLMGRAPRPGAVRIRKSAIQIVVLGAASLLAGSLAWAFVVQPELRTSAAARTSEARDETPGPVRPSEQITDQPATYDRLPAEPADFTPPVSRGVAVDDPAGPVHPRPWRSSDQPGPTTQARASGLFFPGAPVGPTTRDREPLPSRPGSPPATPPPSGSHRLMAGTVIPAVLLTGIDTSRAGPVVATVSQGVYDSLTGRTLLVPQGARLIGRHEGASDYGDRRAFLVWQRIILPDGRSFDLDDAPAVDAEGMIGVRGRSDRRLLELGVAALAAGAITTLGEYARGGANADDRGSLLGTVGDAAAIEAARAGGRIIDRELQVRPALRVQPGSPVRVMIVRDLTLEPE